MLVREKVERAGQMNYEAIFSLIDSLLPFEACLYHQILPLSIEGSLLRLGIVDPQDASGVDYARRMLAYLNCSLVTEEISCETQRSVLSAYLNHKGQNKSNPPMQASNAKGGQENKEKRGDLTAKESEAKTQLQKPKERSPNSQNKPTSRLRPPSHLPKPPQPKKTPELELEAVHLSSSVEALVGLEPKQLLEELLARVLLGGIGRLYFERQESGGNILCSQDGILQSVVEELEASKFEEVINELKLLTKMPLTPVEKPQQAEIERMHEGNELLLRLRVMPGNRGEEATLQVLRGAALRFYQQQQLSHLSQDALTLAEQLQKKVNQIRDRTRLVPKSKLENLPVLDKLLKDVEQEIKSLLGGQ